MREATGMRRLRTSARLTACFTVGIALVAASATATPVLTLTQGATTIKVQDLNNDGVVTYAGSVGDYLLDLSIGVSNSGDSLSTGDALLDLFSFNVKAGFASAPLTITLEDSGYVLPYANGTPLTAVGSLTGSVAALGNSSVTFQSSVNGQNIYSPAQTFTNGDFNTSSLLAVPYSSPFTLFSQAIINFTAPGAVVFNEKTVVSGPAPTNMPEPSSWALLLTGLFAFVAWRGARVRHASNG
jgi:hypothetical protein